MESYLEVTPGGAGASATAPGGDEVPGLPPEAGRIAVALWEAAEALRLLAAQAQRLRLPEPTVVHERLTFEVLRGVAVSTGHYAELVAGQVARQPASRLVMATPEDARRLLASIREAGAEIGG